MNQAPSKTRDPPNLENDPRYLELSQGGVLSPLLRWARLFGDTPSLVRRRVVVLALLAWLPLLLLSVAEGNLLGDTVAVPFLRDVEAHVRFLLVIPLLLIAEVEARRFLPALLQEFPQRGLVPAEALPSFEAAVGAASRLRKSVLAEVALIAIVYGVGIFLIFQQYGALYATTWYATTTAEVSQLTLAGRWYLFVSLPMVQFLLLRWYLWLFIWARFLWQVSRIELDLAIAHPDRAGGLGFLETTGHAFGMLAVAHGALTAGPIASQIFFKGAALPEFADEVALVVIVVVCMILSPLLFFSQQLVAAKKSGLFRYGRLAERYVREFDHKWLRSEAPVDEPLVGSADIQSLADLGGAYEVVEGLRIAPVSIGAVIRLVIATLVPVAPLLLTLIPLNELVRKLFGAVF